MQFPTIPTVALTISEHLQKEVIELMKSIEGRQFMAHANSILDGEEMTKETAQVFDQREITI